jgi:LacI family transcriptional regulator
MARTTVKDVAAHSGYSVATVSAVVNGAGWVSDETRRKVEQAVSALDYRPNRTARSLKTQQTHAVGAIVSDLTNPFFTQVVRSVSHALHASGRNLFLCDADHRFAWGRSHFETLMERQIDGLLLVGDSVPDDVLERHSRRASRVPVVAVGRAYEIDGVSTLMVDSEQASYAATRHLVETGRQRVAVISGPSEGPGQRKGALRVAGWRRALQQAGLPCGDELVVEGTFRFDGGAHAMQTLLSRSERPDAVFCANDLTALGALQALRSFGLDAPADVALVGFDDIPLAQVVSPPLTTVAMPVERIGRRAAALLHEQMEGGAATVHERMEARLVVRASSLATAFAT